MFNLQKDIDSLEFWNGAKKGRLMIKKCNKSSKYFLYSGDTLALQKGLDYEWVEASGKGTIYSYTKSNIPGGSIYYLNKIPYIIAIVLLEEGVRIITNIHESDERNIKIGKSVKVIFQKLDENITFPCFKIIN